MSIKHEVDNKHLQDNGVWSQLQFRDQMNTSYSKAETNTSYVYSYEEAC